MGHRSDAVDKYQVTGDKQREHLCKIIREEPSVAVYKVNNVKSKENDKGVVCEESTIASNYCQI